VLLSLWLIPEFGVIGAAVSAAIVLSIQNIIAMTLVWRRLEIMPLPWLGVLFEKE
jgi:O-antigen/teichoic acid export membrane protein